MFLTIRWRTVSKSRCPPILPPPASISVNRKSQVNQIVKSFSLNIEIDLEVLESEFENGHLMFTINANNQILIKTDSSERKDIYHNIMDNFGHLSTLINEGLW
ncbi:unnamed protein product [Lactuca saligna]|uniref:Uncharacterized protein n=1 Tax=Lactuca saligna TaxID=75948 RepID=A0AA35ZC85_LACSI|nr:unnamed protein product [Lactuca saligna]